MSDASLAVVVEWREYAYRQGGSVLGRSYIWVTCPFCGVEVKAYVWSMAGCGKKCPCGAIHYWLSGKSKKAKDK